MTAWGLVPGFVWVVLTLCPWMITDRPDRLIRHDDRSGDPAPARPPSSDGPPEGAAPTWTRYSPAGSLAPPPYWAWAELTSSSAGPSPSPRRAFSVRTNSARPRTAAT